MNNVKNLAIFLAVVVAVTVVDLVTKGWAARNLASLDHAVPLLAEDADEGKTLEEFLKGSRFPELKSDVVLLLQPGLETKSGEDYPTRRITQDRGYYVFLSDDKSISPRFMPNPALKEFYARREEGLSREEWKKSRMAKKISWEELLTDEFSFLGEEEIDELLVKHRIHPLPMHLPPLPAATKVRKGDVFLAVSRSIEVVPGFLRFIYAENPGAAWGILRDAPLYVRIIFLQVFSLAAMLLILFVAWKVPPEHIVSLVGLAAIMGGAVGNFVERFDRHVVIDFMDMYIKNAHWPTYNVADIGITVGVALLFIQILRKQSPF